MTHPSDDDLVMLVDADAPADVATRLTDHLGECADCRHLLAQLRETATILERGLGALDHPPPQLSAGAVIARARSRRRRGVRRALAAAALLCVTAAVAVALPYSPVRRLVARLFTAPPAPRTRESRPDTALPPARREQARAPSGVSFASGRQVTIVFREIPDGGSLRIRLVADAGVTITGTGSDNRFTLTTDGVTIDGATGSAFDVDIPARVVRASVRVGTRVVFTKSGAGVTGDGVRDSLGTYVISLASLHRSTP